MATATELPLRVAELETQLAFQEDTVQTLNDIVARQQLQIDRLEHDVRTLLAQMQQDSDALGRSQGEEAPPPHY